ncbi:AraC family transcriptional regulator, partial [Bacteroides xylanisolvens]
MPGDSFCIQYTNCTGCPKNVENILVYRNLPKGEHIPPP